MVICGAGGRKRVNTPPCRAGQRSCGIARIDLWPVSGADLGRGRCVSPYPPPSTLHLAPTSSWPISSSCTSPQSTHRKTRVPTGCAYTMGDCRASSSAAARSPLSQSLPRRTSRAPTECQLLYSSGANSSNSSGLHCGNANRRVLQEAHAAEWPAGSRRVRARAASVYPPWQDTEHEQIARALVVQ